MWVNDSTGLTGRQLPEVSLLISLTMLRTHVIFVLTLLSCSSPSADKADPAKASKTSPDFKPGSFGFDLQFLSKYDSLIVLKNASGQAQVIVSPKYQGKVFTSTAEGHNGPSFGWINYRAFDTLDPHMNAYGGENRLWLGPEGGPFSLYFPKGAEMIFDNWKVPAPIDTEPWSVKSVDSFSVHLEKNGKLKNYSGTTIQFRLDRIIRIMDSVRLQQMVNGSITKNVEAIGYTTENIITNTGGNSWSEKTGAPCIWILDMFPPSYETTIIIPYKDSSYRSKVVTTDYFGEIPPDRIQMRDGIVYFLGDGRRRGKLGITPPAAKNFAGSYDAKENVLTIVAFSIDPTAKYLNQEWVTDKPPFSGDAVNAYNDGPLISGNQLGPFYEIESVGPAALLRAGTSADPHEHAVMHFTGSKEGLNRIAMKVFGVSLEQIQNAFK